MMTQKKRAFTLVELIVVITILGILWTIAFISLQGYSKNARNSIRVSDISSIEKSLTLYHINVWHLPEPTLWVDIVYSWSLVWNQWTIWNSVTTNLRNLNKVPVDPLTWTEYTYSRLNTKKEFEIAWIYEWDRIASNNIIIDTYAAQQKASVYVKWDYNWKIIRANTWSLSYILAVPTIISWDITLTDIQEIINQKKLAYSDYQNLPDSYMWTIFEMNWWFDFCAIILFLCFFFPLFLLFLLTSFFVRDQVNFHRMIAE